MCEYCDPLAATCPETISILFFPTLRGAETLAGAYISVEKLDRKPNEKVETNPQSVIGCKFRGQFQRKLCKQLAR